MLTGVEPSCGEERSLGTAQSVSLGHRVVLSATRPLLGLGKKSHRGYHYLPTRGRGNEDQVY